MANSTTALISFILLYLVCGGTARGRDESNALQEQTVPDAENSEQRDGKSKLGIDTYIPYFKIFYCK